MTFFWMKRIEKLSDLDPRPDRTKTAFWRLLTMLVLVGVLIPSLGASYGITVPSQCIEAGESGGSCPKSERWTAYWIQSPGTLPEAHGVYHFRREFELEEVPEVFRIRVTADQRYQLFVNGERISSGPVRGDLQHWQYDALDISDYLEKGTNVLASVVWNQGEETPIAQVSHRTGFWLQGESEAESMVDTSRSWLALNNPAYEVLPYGNVRGQFYYIAGPGEEVDGQQYPWEWEQCDSNSHHWLPAEEIVLGSPRGERDAPGRWMLVPRSIPFMREVPGRLKQVRLAEGAECDDSFLTGETPLRVQANTKVRLVLDNDVLETAYLELFISGGKGARIEVSYAESLWIPGSSEKGNRNEVHGKEFEGLRDVYVLDGGIRSYRPLFWRTFRYIQLSIETKDESVVLSDIKYTRTGYPLIDKSHFSGGPSDLESILETGWRTAQLNAHESFMDCPYYEQLQYVGDARIQSLASMLLTGDGRLARQAIAQINHTRGYEGLPYSRAPSSAPQYIPTFSLWWIGMVHDYWLYQPDSAFVKTQLPGVRAVLSYFLEYRSEGGLLKRVPWWNFVDWVASWERGVPPISPEGHSSILDLQLLLALQWAAEMENHLGSDFLRQENLAAAEQLKQAILETYWDDAIHAFADTPERHCYSQHANVLAVLAGLITDDEARGLLQRIEESDRFAPVSLYFRYYLDEARRIAGLGSDYFQRLLPWREMLREGLTTWAEEMTNPRSDCHAWGISPNIHVFQTTLGIESIAPGFSRVRIQPQAPIGESVSGAIPHPKGEIRVSISHNSEGSSGTVFLPPDLLGDLVLDGKTMLLQSGLNRFDSKRP